MKGAPMMAAALWIVGVAAVTTIFYVSLTRGFLIGAVEFGTVLGGGVLLALMLAFGLIDRRAVDRLLLRPVRFELIAAGFFTFCLAATAALAVQFPSFPWPAGVLAGLFMTAAIYNALALRDQTVRH